MADKKIIDRIKKLLNMKHGGSAAEVETALAMAQKLASEHGIAISDVPLEGEEKITNMEEKVGSRLQYECRYVSAIVTGFFNVDVIIQSFMGHKSLIFIGTSPNIEIAFYIYTYLVKHFRYEWNHHRGRLRNRNAFMQGMAYGVTSKLRESASMIKQEYGLILAGDKGKRDKYISEKFPNVKPQRYTNETATAALMKGYRAGRNTEIRKGVKGKEPLQLSDGGLK